jgi:NADPH:quinone reductase-like Zn-dependent oxidoreductase
MKAVLCTKYGPAEVLKLSEVETPTPKGNQVLVKVHATTAHVGDVRIRGFDVPRATWPIARLILGITKPKNPILGMELAGEVVALGENAKLFKEGDHLFALTLWSGFGGYAEYVCLPEDGMLAIKPANMTFAEAAAVPGGGLTALMVLRRAELKNGQRVLIYGASGSVGTYAVQFAKHFGADVTGVCSTGNVELVRSLGADRVIDYTKEDFTKSGETYDVVFDAVDKISSSRAKTMMKKTGIYLSVGRDSGSKKDLKKDDLDYIRELIEAGKIRAIIDRHYPLEEIVDAHRYVEEGHKRGNVAITVIDD